MQVDQGKVKQEELYKLNLNQSESEVEAYVLYQKTMENKKAIIHDVYMHI